MKKGYFRKKLFLSLLFACPLFFSLCLNVFAGDIAIFGDSQVDEVAQLGDVTQHLDAAVALGGHRDAGVRGLEGRYDECRARAASGTTGSGVKFLGLSDEDMLACQEALPPGQRHERRMALLRDALRRNPPS